jgi:DNA-binding response OmpR family regulator
VRLLILAELLSKARGLGHTLTQNGFVVDALADPTAGDYQARGGDYDVILLDLKTLQDNPLNLVACWRQAGLSACVLVLLPPRAEAREGVAALNLGADDYLIRPFRMEELLARLRALVRRRYESKDPVIRIYDLEINTAKRIVRRAGQTIRLTPREYALLQFLAFHRGKVVTRTMITNALYDPDGERLSNVVDVYIRYLRTKIDNGFEPPLILTRRGQGYILRGDEGEAKP